MLSAALYEEFGTAAIVWERAAGITLLALALLWWASSLARLWIAAAAVAVVMFAAWPALTERPQLAGFVLLVPVLAAWWQTGLDHRPRWWLVPVTWLAAATHGVWATAAGLGALVTAALIASRRLTRQEALRLVSLLAGCAAAAALTPLGPRLLLTPFTVSSQGRQFVQEWLPSSVRALDVMAALLLLAAVWMGWIGLRMRPPAWQLCLWLAALALALTMHRTVAVAAFIALPLVCTTGEQIAVTRSCNDRARIPFVAWGAGALVGLVLAAPLAGSYVNEAPETVPTALEPRLAALPDGSRLLVDSDTSGWVMHAAPNIRPIYDLRVESYDPEQVRGYITMMDAAPGWDRLLAASGARAALVAVDAPIRAALVEQAGWEEWGEAAGLVLIGLPQ